MIPAKFVVDSKTRAEFLKLDLFEQLRLNPSKDETKFSGGTSDLLPMEREKASFQVKELEDLWNNHLTNKRKFIETVIPKSIQSVYNREEMSREEVIAEHVEYFAEIHANVGKWRPKQGDISFMVHSSTLEGSLGLSVGQFANTIKSNGTPEQVEFWLPKILSFEVTGAYSQTELAHGSSVKLIQTTARLDPATHEFVIHTPTLGATKWWNTSLICSTHCALAAQLYDGEGNHFGVNYFLIQIRDHALNLLPGIDVFELGDKLGNNAHDIGAMSFQNVRVSKDTLLSRFGMINEKGIYTKRTNKKKSKQSANGLNDKLKYIPMMQTRLAMITGSATELAKGATIAARYSAVRKQGLTSAAAEKATNSKEETCILDYQVQKYRIIRGIAQCWAFKSVARNLGELLFKVRNGDEEALKVLPQTHSSLSGLKALCTYMTGDTLEDMRRSCGGHGVLNASGISKITSKFNSLPVIAEGDNTIMILQTGKYLLRQYNKAIAGDPDLEIAFLGVLSDSSYDPVRHAKPKQIIHNANDLIGNLEYWRELYLYRALVHINQLGKNSNRLQKQGSMNEADAFRTLGIEAKQTSSSYLLYMIVTNFIDEIRSKTASNEIINVLNQLCCLFCISNVIESPLCVGSWIGLLDLTTINTIQQSLTIVLDSLRPNVIAIVDAFAFDDRVLNSAIGCYDGNVYERLFESSVKSSLNFKPNGDRISVPPFLDKLRPYLNVELLKQGADLHQSKNTTISGSGKGGIGSAKL